MGEIIPRQIPASTFSLVAQNYLIWSEAEQQVSPETIQKRIDCLHQVVRIVGEKPVTLQSAARSSVTPAIQLVRAWTRSSAWR